MDNGEKGYGWPAKLLHWVMAFAIISMLLLGWYMDDVARGLHKIQLYGLHKSIGSLLLGLILVRIGWRLANLPAPSVPMPRWQKWAAHGSHLLLYAAMVTMPLSGWLMSSAYGFPVSVFGWFTLPDLVAPDKVLADRFATVHWLGMWMFFLLIPLHAAAALLHHFYYRDRTLERMLP